MTFLETLQTHRGGLLHIKSELYWYGGRGWDGTPDRVCLILDAAAFAASLAGIAVLARVRGRHLSHLRAAALLLIDGAPQWIWVAHADVELIT